MSLKGLRFTLDVDGLGQKTFAVVNFVLRQRHSFPFVLDIDVASDSFGETAEKLLEKNATLTIWQGNTPQRYVSGIVISTATPGGSSVHISHRPTTTWRSGRSPTRRATGQRNGINTRCCRTISGITASPRMWRIFTIMTNTAG